VENSTDRVSQKNRHAVRICIDGTFWGPDSPPSAMHVTRDLVRTWAESYREDDITVIVPRASVDQARQQLRRFGVAVEPAPAFLGRLPQAVSAVLMGWTAGGVRRTTHREFDAVLTHNFATLASKPISVCLLHDILFDEHREWFTRPELMYFRAIRPILRYADVILTTSISETERVRQRWPEVRGRVRPIGLAAASEVVGADSTPPASTPHTPFVLAVGRLNTRKNLARLISAFASVRCSDPSMSLVIVGGRDGSLQPLGEHPGVYFTGRISDPELVWFYQNCRAFVFPSLGEGFGLPLLEADAHGVPIACSDLAVFRELGVADEYFDALDVASMTTALQEVLAAGRHDAPRRRTEHNWPEVVRAARAAIGERLG
jgi:glycosyltransferase involved in cell wall biosynthesis